MRIFISAVSAKMGGAANYLREVATGLAGLNTGNEFIFMVPPEKVEMLRALFPGAEIIGSEASHAPFWKRIWFDQVTLPRILRERQIDCLFSTADFGTLKSPCRQILLVRNGTYFFEMYMSRFSSIRPLRERVQTVFRRWLVCQSVRAADVVMSPSQAMMDELRRWAPVPEAKAFVNHYGINPCRFSGLVRQSARDGRTLLFTSLYTEHKNMRTLLKAIKILADWGCPCKLLTTADPMWEGPPRTSIRAEEATLFAELRQQGVIDFPGVVSDTASLYGRGDVFVYPSVVESFGHPLVEAMSAGLPVIASDTPVNRELAGDSALYFPPFDATKFAESIRAVLENPQLRSELVRKGRERIRLFTWQRHLDALLERLQTVHEEALR
ncbi:MAG TPA: glycosyltransferase family 1 protein [Candidatus Angelobacter sp.]|nr:glycosyltransferase family 1 protein [Candidatus Angelobacter sp.]